MSTAFHFDPDTPLVAVELHDAHGFFAGCITEPDEDPRFIWVCEPSGVRFLRLPAHRVAQTTWRQLRSTVPPGA